MLRQQPSKIRPILEVLEDRLCLSAADLLGAGSAPDPVDSHGTHVAGTIGAAAGGIGAATPGDDVPADQFETAETSAIDTVLGVAPTPVPAHVDYFLKVEGIVGEATNDSARAAPGTNFFDGRLLRATDLSRDQALGGWGDDWITPEDVADAAEAPYQGRRSTGGYVPT